MSSNSQLRAAALVMTALPVFWALCLPLTFTVIALTVFALPIPHSEGSQSLAAVWSYLPFCAVLGLLTGLLTSLATLIVTFGRQARSVPEASRLARLRLYALLANVAMITIARLLWLSHSWDIATTEVIVRVTVTAVTSLGFAIPSVWLTGKLLQQFSESPMGEIGRALVNQPVFARR